MGQFARCARHLTNSRSNRRRGHLPGVRGTFPTLAVTRGYAVGLGRAAPDQPLRLWDYAHQRCYRPLPMVLLAVDYAGASWRCGWRRDAKGPSGLTFDLLVKDQAEIVHLRLHLFIDGNIACFAKSLAITGAGSRIRMGRAPRAWWGAKPCQN